MKCDELKAFDVGLGQYCEDGSPCVVAFDADRNPRLLNEKVYLKSDVDNAIAELKQKLQDQCISCPVKMQEDDVVAEKDNEIRRLKRALYKACANWADVVAFEETEGIGHDNSVAERWRKMERKCLNKMEEYK